MIRPIPKRWRRGAAEILLVLVVAAVAAAALLHHYQSLEVAAVQDQREADGRIFAGWLKGAHRATMELDYSAAMPGGTALTQAGLRTDGMVPPGLPEGTRHGTVFLGAIDDDPATSPDVPMAFAVLRVDGAEKVAPVARGALLEGLAFVERVGDGGPMTDRHRTRIETLLGSALNDEDLLVTADLGIRVDPALAYRRAQPGKPWLNAMEADLVMSDSLGTRRAISGVGALGATTLGTLGDVQGDSITVAGDVFAPQATAGTLDATSIDAGSIRVDGDLLILGDVFLSGPADARSGATTPGTCSGCDGHGHRRRECRFDRRSRDPENTRHSGCLGESDGEQRRRRARRDDCHSAARRSVRTTFHGDVGHRVGQLPGVRGARAMKHRHQRGLTLFGSLLALVLIGLMVVAGSRFLTAELTRRTERRAIEQLAELSRAAHEYVLDRFATLVAGPASQEVTLGQLRTARVLAPASWDVDVMGRGYRVLLVRPGPEAIDMVVTQTFAAGTDESWPWRPLTQVQSPAVRLGTVSADDPSTLRGPAINLDIAPVQAAFGVPQVRSGGVRPLRPPDGVR